MLWVWRNKYYQFTYTIEDKTMDSYIFFDDALRILVNAFLASAILLVAASGIGLAVIESIEKASDR
ncbi:hypothetical protein DSM106972_041630 [Dulcicalothrix desertica PCC 7102]|jgi:hypothetical protein|uniref:Uncharacterized protein n=1 Tax=Dulcicalothrix desertica PCC 7102 TaxID=232991 RepID=A0A3S1AMT5_9CYAN|nr:hypothetical protein NIES2101_18310 [Calothrix sp. HK-06]RUT04594.1 hypothetical protein DSM106972_041630 [Dulcicalothrix desertica PCC 7102]